MCTGATSIVDNNDGQAAEKILEATHGKGVDAVIECVGMLSACLQDAVEDAVIAGALTYSCSQQGNPAGWYVCEKIVRASGRIAILGVHGKRVTVHLEEMWKRNFSLTGGLVSCNTIDMLASKMADGTLNALPLLTHHFELQQMETAYDTFINAEKHHAVKMLLKNEQCQ